MLGWNADASWSAMPMGSSSMAGPSRPALGAASPMSQPQPQAYRWIKTACGRAKYDALASRPGLWGRVRLAWFVLIGGLRDWRLPPSDS